MADRSHGRADKDAKDTDELLYTDLHSSVSGLDSPPLKLDHCDRLLDAIDAQLGQLQVQPQKHQAISREHDCSDAAPLNWSQSLSKDTGLGSTTQTNDTPISCLDLINTLTMEQTSESSTGCRDGPITHEETKLKLDRRTRDKEEIETQREQVMWRLQRLLGDTCNEGSMTGVTQPPSDSICTEDFVRCFRDEMVELALPVSNVQQLDKEEEAERTEILDCDTCQSEQKGHCILNVDRRGTAMTGESNKDTETAHYCQRKELEKCLYDSYGVNTSCSEQAGAGETYNTPQRLGDDGSSIHRTEIVTEHETLRQNSRSPKTRSLAGVPVWSFDTVSIDSDLDSVCTEQVRQHIHRQTGWRSLTLSVTGMDDYCTNQSDYDTSTQEESEPRSTSGQRSSYGNGHNRSPSVSKAQRNKRETYRLVCSLEDNDTDEEMNHWPKRTSDKMHSDWVKMKERLSTLRQKCEKEEQTLQNKKTQLKDVELCLSELQHRRKHALQELEQLTVETAQMEKETRTLEFVLRDRRAGKDSISCQLHELQRQRESCILEVRDMKEELTTLSQSKQTLKDSAFTERPSVVMSVLEREEMERQLDNAKTELFAEQRRAREKQESMQEKLEETREELQRVTEAESVLRNSCPCLEEKQRQKKDHMEAVEFQVSELQGELGECKIRVGTQEKMLAQKELQLLDLQEQRGALQAESDGLKRELQHLKTQHCNARKEDHEQAHRMMEAALKQQKKELALAHEQQIQKVNQQTKEEKANALKEQALSLTRHTEALKSSIQLKEEEAKTLRDSLEQQKQEAKNREEELHVEALEKVHKAIEEERRKWEAEKVEAVQVHCGILEEQNRKRLKSMRSEMQREKSKALALQHKMMELKTRIQEMESESCAQQREQKSLLAVICKSLKEEYQAELQKLQRQVAQESQRAALRLEQAAQLAEKEADRLRVMLEERERSHNQITAELDQQLRLWAKELGAECQHLHLLVEQSGAKQSSVHLTPSPTAAEALTNLRTLREQLKQLINHLQQELDSQKQTTEQLRKDKESELSIQRQQLRMNRDQALDSLKERLIQEHIEELSSLNWPHMCDGGAEGGGAAASLRKQLKAKDLELRQVQRSMGQWKEQTAARLACKFEEELTAELERCKTKLLRCRKPSKTREESQRKCERPEGQMMFSAKEAQNSVCSPSLHVVASAASHSPSDVASFKLLRYLQSRVKQLRVENQTYTQSPSPSNTIPLDLAGSYLTTITQGQAVPGIQSHSSIRTVSS
ncbi:trichohyalin isoform X1 [Perca flavescens]|uniref:trichohyalin isoform X1 n=1 Tax=Perca flavescens TaxID=8167 RepID=UPI00106DE4B8|nr:trichohyalin-like isoform X1 [Perca flavescens]XP_028433051.1 trichohyalin-like isoform X1 [Perca flavescens]